MEISESLGSSIVKKVPTVDSNQKVSRSSSTATAQVPLSKALNPLTLKAELSTEGCSYTGLHTGTDLWQCVNNEQGREQRTTQAQPKPARGWKHGDISTISLHILPWKSATLSSPNSSVCFPLSSVTVIVKTSHHTTARWFNSDYRDISYPRAPVHEVPNKQNPLIFCF